MALTQATAPTTTTSLDESINSEYISRLLDHAAVDPTVGEFILTEDHISPEVANSFTYDLPSVNEFAGAAAVTENDAAAEEEMEESKITITGARIGLRSFVLDRTRAAIMRVANEVIMGLDHAIRDKLHKDALALFTSLSNSEGSNATTHTLSNHDGVMTNFLAQNYDPGQLWQVLHSDGLRDLRQDLATNAASLFGAAYGDRAANALKANQPGLGTLFDGILTFVSGDVPVGDTTGWTNAVGVGTPMDNFGGLLGVFWQEIMFEMQRDAGRFGTWMVASNIYGVGIRKNANARAFITKT